MRVVRRLVQRRVRCRGYRVRFSAHDPGRVDGCLARLSIRPPLTPNAQEVVVAMIGKKGRWALAYARRGRPIFRAGRVRRDRLRHTGS